jgi:capsular polysaccharide export protein
MLSASTGAASLPEGPVPSAQIGLLDSAAHRQAGLTALLPEAKLLSAHEAAGVAAIAVLAGTAGVARTRALATARALPYTLLEPGLLRAPRLGARPPALLSVMIAEASGGPGRSGLRAPDQLLETDGWDTPDVMARARAAIAALAAARAGGAWWAPDPGPAGLGLSARAILVVAGPDGAVDRLLEAALAAHEPGRIALVGAPTAAPAGAWRRAATHARARGCTIVTAPSNPWSLIEAADGVFSADREFGFLALLAGCTVHCGGPAFYAGWGVTRDHAAQPPRARPRTIEHVFAAACLLASRYADPFTGRPCSFEDTVALIDDWRRVNAANRAIAVCVGMSFWKRRRVADFLRSSDGPPAFRRGAAGAARRARARSGAVAVWASREPAGLRAAAARHDVPILTVEDGFLRSVGLGADFMPAASMVVDGRGIYYDPTRPSDLETLLAETAFDARLLERARSLIALLVARGITKYNIGGAAPPDLGAPAGVRRILVPGQVEDDRSVTLGGAGVAGNLELLQRVRAANPDAFIVYKPHPDVDAGHRRGAVADATARAHADCIVRGVSSAALLATVEEVHTLTSLVGFEGLLRHRGVVVYGQPFYAGWGLTTDRVAVVRRTRKLSLEQLVAGALILYPRYLDPVTRLPCGPEVIIDRLSDPALWRAGPLVWARRIQGALTRRLNIGRVGP